MSENAKLKRRQKQLHRTEDVKINDPRGFEIHDFSNMAQLIDELVRMGKKKQNIIWSTTSVDVTEALKKIKEYKQKTGKSLSFTAFVIAVFARVVSYHKNPMNGMMKGRKKLYVFDDVDVSTNIERTLPDGTKKPVSVTIRKAHQKTLKEISEELRSHQNKKTIQASSAKRGKILTWVGKNIHNFPSFIRKAFIRKMLSDPEFKKKNFGTVNVTAVGMFGSGLGHMIHLTPHTLSLGVGGMETLPYNVEGKIINRDQVALTIAMNHTVIDGGPAARFFHDLRQWFITFCHDADWCFKSLEE